MVYFEKNMVQVEESIISGASIFYGSVSNVVIGEAKAVQDLRSPQNWNGRTGMTLATRPGKQSQKTMVKIIIFNG